MCYNREHNRILKQEQMKDAMRQPKTDCLQNILETQDEKKRMELEPKISTFDGKIIHTKFSPYFKGFIHRIVSSKKKDAHPVTLEPLDLE